MKKAFAFCILLMGLTAAAQTPDRGNATSDRKNGLIIGSEEKGITYAVLVGISKYANIENLLYADDDAILFSDYLRTQGVCQKENIALLIDSAATKARFFAELNKIKNKLQPNDRVIIYFAGHGDVETDLESGFLLTYNSEKYNYAATSIDVNMLQRYVDAFIKKQSSVIVITDACRSGNLAGGLAGASTTLSALTSSFNNCIKILSCQPDQLSQEKYYLNGGHGVFTYHLVNALHGLADKNQDRTISLRELDIYLDRVTTETEQRQIPKVDGNPQSILCAYNDSIRAQTATQQDKIPSNQFNIKRNASNPKLDSNRFYRKFKNQLNSGSLIEPDQNNAYQRIQEAISAKQDANLISNMRIELSAVIEDEVQGFINQILRAENKFSNRRRTDAIKYHNLISTCVALTEQDDPRMEELSAKQTYFEARMLYYTNDSSKFREITQKLKLNATKSNPALTYNELGSISFQIGEIDSSFFFYKKAMQYSPTWVYPVANTGWNYHLIGKDSLALIYLHRAKELEPNHPWVNGAIGEIYMLQAKFELAESFIKRSLWFDSTSFHQYQVYGQLVSLMNDWPRSDSLYAKALSIDSTQYESWVGIGVAKLNRGDLKAVKQILEKLILIGPITAIHHESAGNLALRVHRYELADSLFTIAATLDRNRIPAWNGLGIAKASKKDYVGAELAFKNLLTLDRLRGETWYNLACTYALMEQIQNSIQHFEMALKCGYLDFNQFESDPDLANLRKEKGYTDLLKKYKPKSNR